jgi:surfactin synthase thioesterase subunit
MPDTTGAEATPSWCLADYREPLMLVCAAADPRALRAFGAWQRAAERNVRLLVFPVPGRASDATIAALAHRVSEAAAGRPCAMFGHARAAATLLRLVPLLGTSPPVTRLIAAAAVPPNLPAAGQVAISAMCGAQDPVVPPAAAAGWRRLSAEPFSLQVFDTGGGFLWQRPTDVLAAAQLDLRTAWRHVPGRGFPVAWSR